MAWLTGWQYRKSHVINNASGAGTNYQIKVKVYYGTGTDSGENVYLNSHSRTDFGDVRFTDDDGTTLLDYWIESKVDSDNAVFWVEVADDLSTANQTIYIYYGKSDATTTSNIDNTMIFGDDFLGTALNSSKWEWEAGIGSITVADGKVRIQCSPGTGVDPAIRALNGVDPLNKKFECKLKFATLSSSKQYGFSARSNGYLFYWLGTANNTAHDYYIDTNGGGFYEHYVDVVSWSNNTDYIVRSAHKTGKNLYERDTSSWTYTTTSFPSGISLKILLGFYFYNYNGTTYHTVDLYIDWCFIRKWVDPEPTHGSWGSEESSGAVTRTLTDYYGLLDVQVKYPQKILIDKLGLKDIVVKIKSFILRDYLGLLDTKIKSITKIHIDKLGQLDTKRILLIKILIDKLGELDSKKVSLIKVLMDKLGELDVKVKKTIKLFIDKSGLLDVLETYTGYVVRILTDTLGLLDSKIRVVSLHRLFTDKLGQLDVLSKSIVKQLSDTLGLKDVKVLVKNITRIFLEKIALLDRKYIIPKLFKWFKYRLKQHPKQRVEVSS